MSLVETLIFYLCVGVTTAVAVLLAEERGGRARIGFLLLTALLFWPLYLPLLLSARREGKRPVEPATASATDAMAGAIAQVELELDAALSSLDGWAENALAGEADRIAELCHALRAQAVRIREMDKLLAAVEAEPAGQAAPADAAEPDGSQPDGPTDEALERYNKSQEARAHNLSRLADVRLQTHADLMATLAWIRELVSMIHLAKFTGAPASRAEELVAQIAAAVEGVSAISWPDADSPAEPLTGAKT